MLQHSASRRAPCPARAAARPERQVAKGGPQSAHPSPQAAVPGMPARPVPHRHCQSCHPCCPASVRAQQSAASACALPGFAPHARNPSPRAPAPASPAARSPPAAEPGAPARPGMQTRAAAQHPWPRPTAHPRPPAQPLHAGRKGPRGRRPPPCHRLRLPSCPGHPAGPPLLPSDRQQGTNALARTSATHHSAHSAPRRRPSLRLCFVAIWTRGRASPAQSRSHQLHWIRIHRSDWTAIEQPHNSASLCLGCAHKLGNQGTIAHCIHLPPSCAQPPHSEQRLLLPIWV
mmetsp:Transcript_40306/g.115192  ORF Transcript_40306/g.115192 Transcript_40306/m.115192 type:complete len:288 (-) Transcript_40306:624-1487(-)